MYYGDATIKDYHHTDFLLTILKSRDTSIQPHTMMILNTTTGDLIHQTEYPDSTNDLISIVGQVVYQYTGLEDNFDEIAEFSNY